jgi:hypothetical protein
VDVGPFDELPQNIVKAASTVGQRVFDLWWDGWEDGPRDEPVALEPAKITGPCRSISLRSKAAAAPVALSQSAATRRAKLARDPLFGSAAG